MSNKEIDNDEIDDKETKSDKKLQKQKRISKLFIILIIIILVGGILEFFTDAVSNTYMQIKYMVLRMIGIEDAEGNTIGNIRNYGYLASDNKYLYYMCPSDTGKYVGIRKIRKDLKGESTILIEDDWEITGINQLNGYLYFITMADKDSETDNVDNKIHRMKVNGTNDEVINDNDFNNNCYEIYVIDNKIYYIGIDNCIYFMDLDGKNKTKLNDNATGYIGITNEYILYNMEEANGEDVKIVTYIMDRDGKNPKKLTDGRLNDVCRHISRIRTDGTGNEMLSDVVAYNLNVTEDEIFYLGYYKVENENAGVSIYRMNLDGSKNREINRMDNYTESLCQAGNWLLYTDSTDDEGRVELLSKDGNKVNVLFRLNFADYYDLDTLKEELNNNQVTNTEIDNATNADANNNNNSSANNVSTDNVNNTNNS